MPAADALKGFAKERANKLGYKLLTDNIRGGKVDDQLSSVNSFITRNVDALVVHATDPNSYDGLTRRAKDAEIPLFTYGASVPNTDGAVLFPSPEAAKKLSKDAASWVQENLGGEEAQILILGFTADPVSREASKAMASAIVDQNLGRVVAEQDALDQATGQRVTEDVLKASPGVNVVLAWNDGGALGAAAALKNTNKDASKVYIASNEGAEQGIQAMLDGNEYLKTLNLLSIQELGYAIVNIAHRYFESEKTGDIVVGRRIVHNDQKEELQDALSEY